MNAKRKHEIQKELQAVVNEALRVLNCDFPVELKISAEEEELGSFWPEWHEDRGMTRSMQGYITLADFTKYSKDELIELLWRQITIHELGHALQFRPYEMEEDSERESDHDAEFGIHFARAYTQVQETDILSLEDAQELLGLTQERRDAIVQTLTEAIEKDIQND
ncbi:MAG TPA: hypothetical protein EYF98_15120 [Planctomycetes bacterium]|jgi:hypothetical protein|nr:hypothetical protein [Planctomycetota bacterium]